MYIRQEPHREQIGGVTKSETMHRMTLRASCAPVRTLFGHHWAMRHLSTFTGPMGWMAADGSRVETVWCDNGPARSIYDTAAFIGKTGCLYLTEENPALAPGASAGWGWIRTQIWNWEQQWEKTLIPCGPIVSEPRPQQPPEGSLVASVNVSTTFGPGIPLGPGLYMLNLNHGDTTDKTYVYSMDQGREVEVPMIFEPAFLYIRDSSGWYKPSLGVIKDVRPEREFDPVEIPIPPRGPVWP